MRLSIRYRRPLSEVLAWPAAHVRLIGRFLAREPFVEDRLELLLARIACDQFNAHRGDNEPRSVDSYLVAKDAWPEIVEPEVDAAEKRYSEADRKTLTTLMNLRVRRAQ